MKNVTRALIALPLVSALVFTAVTATSPPELTPRDLKAQSAATLVDDVYPRVASMLGEPGGVPCTAGFAGPYPCENVDLLGIVPLAELGGAAGNDSWGWTDPQTGKEYAIMGSGRGTAFIDVTDPVLPVVVASVGQAGGETRGVTGVLWRDVKVNDNHAYIVSERGGGMQVVDLKQLRDIIVPGPENLLEVKATYSGGGFNSAHNIAINEETDRAYLVGGNFSGGLHIVDISKPGNPTFAGGVSFDGYTHDVQCVVYDGPDADYTGRELCFASNEDTITIIDVTNPSNARQVNRIGYSGSRYTHQGWLTPDHRFFVFNDEGDESANSVPKTTTYMVDLKNLDKFFSNGDVKRYTHETESVDHNLYIVGNLIYQANYNAGLRVFRYTAAGLRKGNLTEVGVFDVDPGLDVNQYGGAWNVYPFFESGTILVSSLDEGLYTLRLTAS